MRVHIGGDHAAYEMLVDLVGFLQGEGHDVVNHGPHDLDPQDDYPVFVLAAAKAVATEPGSFGIVLGGSGNGEQMAANKVTGIRAALCYNDDLARLAREHNDAQVLSIGGRMNTLEEARSMATVFLGTAFSGDPRHQRRIDMVTRYEEEGIAPELPDAMSPTEPRTGPRAFHSRGAVRAGFAESPTGVAGRPYAGRQEPDCQGWGSGKQRQRRAAQASPYEVAAVAALAPHAARVRPRPVHPAARRDGVRRDRRPRVPRAGAGRLVRPDHRPRRALPHRAAAARRLHADRGRHPHHRAPLPSADRPLLPPTARPRHRHGVHVPHGALAGAAGHPGLHRRQPPRRPARPDPAQRHAARAARGVDRRVGDALGQRRRLLRRLHGHLAQLRPAPARGGRRRREWQGAGRRCALAAPLGGAQRHSRVGRCLLVPQRRQLLPHPPAMGRGVRDGRPPRPRPRDGVLQRRTRRPPRARPTTTRAPRRGRWSGPRARCSA